VKRWMVAAVAGLVVLGGLLVAPGSAQASSSAWTQVYQVSARGSFFQTAAISQNNIWSVGESIRATGKSIYKPLIRHYDGRSWKAVTIPGASGFTTDWVSASSAKNVWVGGLKTSGEIAATVIYRWNGARWSKIPLPPLTELRSVTVLSPNNVWAYGSSHSTPDSIFHWTGKKWRYYLDSSLNFIPQDLSASGPKNVWVSGFKESGKKQLVAAYRWNGTAWHSVKMPHPVTYAGSSVTAVSASNVWIGWESLNSQEALHWDGHRWHTVAVPNYGNIFDIVPDGKGGYWFGPAASLTGNGWVLRQEPAFTGGINGVTRIPGTTSFLVNAGAAIGDDTVVRPTLFRFDL
jgi:hypothetical protein